MHFTKSYIYIIFLIWVLPYNCYSQVEADTVLANHYFALGNSLLETAKYDSTVIYFEKAASIYEQVTLWQKYISCYNRLCEVYWRNGNYSLALEKVEEALQKSTKISSQNHPEKAKIYSNLGIIYDFKGNYDIALVYHEKALKMRKELFDEKHSSIASSYNNIAIVYYYLGYYDLTLQHYQWALAIQKEVLGKTHPEAARLYNNIGIIYKEKGQYDLALQHYQRALAIQKEVFGKTHPEVARFYNNIGIIYKEKGQYDLALQYYQRALAIQKEVFDKNHPEVARSYNNMGIIYKEKGQYDLALQYYQKSLCANLIGFNDTSIYINPALKNYLDQNQLLEILQAKAETLAKLYHAQNINSTKKLEFSLQTFLLCDTLIDTIRRSYQMHSDKIALGETASKVYEGAIQVSISMYQLTKDSTYLYQAFYFSEKDKAGVLTESLSTLNAKSFGGIPDSLLALEETIIIDRAYYQSQIQNEKANSEGYDTTKVNSYENKLFSLNLSYDSLTQRLEQQYPKYYHLKYQNHIYSVKEIQSLLPDNTALLEYFIGDSTSYLFAFTNSYYNIFTYSGDSIFYHDIIGLRKAMDAHIFSQKPHEAYKMYTRHAYALYKSALEQPLQSLPNTYQKLIIIPDGGLGYIPFDILLSKPDSSNFTGYKNLAYLMQDYVVSYGYSATLLFNVFPNRKIPNQNQFIAFAPVYQEVVSDSSQLLALGRFRDQVVPLVANQKEVKGIGNYMKGMSFLGKEAVEKKFKENAQKYSVVHLAMHALVDDENPMHSKLVFTQSQDIQDSIEDGFLYAHELYKMVLPADLAVLSACNTGFGKMEEGEGIMSLARAFAYAGCPSIVMSHWNVDDDATSELMKQFYKFLSEGLPKDEALHHAKLAFLRKASTFKKHPFYWSSFVIIGDTSPIKQDMSLNQIVLYVVLLIFIIIIFYFFEKLRLKSKPNR